MYRIVTQYTELVTPICNADVQIVTQYRCRIWLKIDDKTLLAQQVWQHQIASCLKVELLLELDCSELSVPFLFRTWLAQPRDVGKVKQKFPWLKNCFYLRAVQLFAMRQPVDPELSLLVLFNIRQHTLERMKKSKGSSIKKFYCLISYFG